MLEIKTRFINLKPSKSSTSKNKHSHDSCKNNQERQQATIGLGIAIIGELFCLGAIAFAYITQKPIFHLLASSPFSTESPLLSYYAFVLLASGLLALIIALNLYNLLGKKRKQISYFLASIGTFFVILSSGLLLAHHTQEQQGLGYLAVMTWGGGYIAMTFSDLTSKEQKRLHNLLKIISLILMLAGLVIAAAG
jgi:heme/copper-type cytochrome/quinol oxidase subunit 3